MLFFFTTLHAALLLIRFSYRHYCRFAIFFHFHGAAYVTLRHTPALPLLLQAYYADACHAAYADSAAFAAAFRPPLRPQRCCRHYRYFFAVTPDFAYYACLISCHDDALRPRHAICRRCYAISASMLRCYTLPLARFFDAFRRHAAFTCGAARRYRQRRGMVEVVANFDWRASLPAVHTLRPAGCLLLVIFMPMIALCVARAVRRHHFRCC